MTEFVIHAIPSILVFERTPLYSLLAHTLLEIFIFLHDKCSGRFCQIRQIQMYEFYIYVFVDNWYLLNYMCSSTSPSALFPSIYFIKSCKTI